MPFCGGLWSFAVVCGSLGWFAMVCGGLSYSHTATCDIPSTALTSDDLDTQIAPVHILLFVAVLFIYGRTFYTQGIS